MGVANVETDNLSVKKALQDVETKLEKAGLLHRGYHDKLQSYNPPFVGVDISQNYNPKRAEMAVQVNLNSRIDDGGIIALFKESFEKYKEHFRTTESMNATARYSPENVLLPTVFYTNIHCETPDELAQLQALLDDFIAKIDNDKKAVTHLFNVAIGHAMHACHKEWELLSQCVGKDYLGYHALGKITNYKTQFENLIPIEMMTKETLKRLEVLYDNVEKDFGRADRVTTALWIAAAVVALLFIAMMIIVVFPHFLMLSTAVAGTLFFGGLMGVILSALAFPKGAMSKQREVDAFGGILETKQNNFHRFFGDHTKMDDEKMGEKPSKEEQSTPLLSITM